MKSNFPYFIRHHIGRILMVFSPPWSIILAAFVLCHSYTSSPLTDAVIQSDFWVWCLVQGPPRSVPASLLRLNCRPSCYRTLVSSIARQHCCLLLVCICCIVLRMFHIYLLCGRHFSVIFFALLRCKKIITKVTLSLPQLISEDVPPGCKGARRLLMEYHALSCSPLCVHRSITEV